MHRYTADEISVYQIPSVLPENLIPAMNPLKLEFVG
jgi:hypothetical protein